METELHKLRIDKSQKAKRDQRPLWPWFLLVLLAAAGGVGAWQLRIASAAQPVETIRVRPVEGQPAHVDDAVALDATGYVMAAHKIEVASRVPGRISWVGVEMGDKVQKGQELVKLEDDEYRARVAQQEGQVDNAKAMLAELEAGSRPQEIAVAVAKLAQAQADLTNDELSLKRLKALEASKAVSQQQIDDADALVRSQTALVEAQRQQYELVKAGPRKEQIDAQRATVRQLQGALSMTKIDLGDTIIRSPVTATVLDRNVEVGEFVTNGFVGDKGAKGYVVSIADLNDLRVELDVDQNNFAKVIAKQKCWITTDAYPDKRYAGIVDLISPEANRQKVTVLVRVKVLNPDDLLKPDMNAKVSFLATPQMAATRASADRMAIRVPATAVRDGAVFVVENGKALRRAVAVVKGNGRDVEVTQGLIGGEDLIVSPPQALQDGTKVKATEARS